MTTHPGKTCVLCMLWEDVAQWWWDGVLSAVHSLKIDIGRSHMDLYPHVHESITGGEE